MLTSVILSSIANTVTGSFNDWSLDDTCRLKEDSGAWRVDIPLKPGCYEYQFIVDGVWMEDPSNPRKKKNPFGDSNSLMEVGGQHVFSGN